MNIFSSEKLEAIILCGGLGTRFREVDDKIPKSLAVVSGKPIIRWLIDDLIELGFSRIILATGHLSKQIENYVGKEIGKICIFSSEHKSLGTGGAIKNAQKLIKSKKFFVLNGDSRIKFNFIKLFEFHNKMNSDMSLLLSSKVNGQDYGNVVIEKNLKIVSFNEKGISAKTNLTNTGVYCMNIDLLEDMEKNTFYSLENDLLPTWVNKKKVYGKVVDRIFTDIGTYERFKNASFS